MLESNSFLSSQHLLVDSHVHYYDCFERGRFFESALSNFEKGAKKLGLNSDWLGCLFLTETHQDHFFRTLRQEALQKASGRWRPVETKENYSLLLLRDDRMKLVVMAGRQIVTREKLEVLALLSDHEFSDGLSLEQTVSEVRHAGAIPVLPWGFGKWLGKRGKVLERFLFSQEKEPLFLGDNGGRPQAWKEPYLFQKAIQKNIFILPGSDPLPFSAQIERVGKVGFCLGDHVDPDFPGTRLKQLLYELDRQPQRFGEGEGFLNFFRYQTAMQLNKYFK